MRQALGKTSTKKKHRPFLLPCLLLGGIILLRILLSESAEQVQLKVFDLFQRIKPRPYRESPVKIIDVDDESLTRLGQWPWPRPQFAQLIGGLKNLGASVIVLDIVFAEPDRTSPLHVLPFWPSTPETETLRAQVEKFPDHDEILAQAFRETKVITSFVLTQEVSDSKPSPKAGFASIGHDPLVYLYNFKGAVVTLPGLEEAAVGNGSFNFLAEPDGIIRRIPLILRHQNSLYPSLVAEALRVFEGVSSFIVKSAGSSDEISFGEHTGIVSLKVGRYLIPTDAAGRLWLYDSGLVAKRKIPAWQILLTPENVESLEGKIVFVGSSAAGLKDLRTTPLNPIASGTEIHVQLVEQILEGNFLSRPDWAPGAEIFYLAILGLVLIFSLPRTGALGCALIGLAAMAFAFGFSWTAFSRFHLLFDPLSPSAASLGLYLVISLINFLQTEAEKRQIRRAFSRYLSPELVEVLAEHPERLKLGGETRTMSILFSDIRGFTTISEQFNAEELTQFLNSFLNPMTRIVLEEKGTIDKYIGDCIMAFWNAPLDDPDHARNACRAALNMRNYLDVWNHNLQRESQEKGKTFHKIQIGIGINTGDCCVGNMGSEQRFDYSVLGDNVNQASRLEGLCKLYNVDLVIGEKTTEQIQDWARLELDLIQVKGKTKPIRIFTLVGDSNLRKASDFQRLESAHQKMLEDYRKKNWTDARACIQECLKTPLVQTANLKMLYAVYEERIASHLANPPAPDWQGVTIALSK